MYSREQPIRISEETEQTLEALRRNDETVDELLDRVAVTRTPDDVEAMAGFVDESVQQQIEETRDELSEAFGENSRRRGRCVSTAW